MADDKLKILEQSVVDIPQALKARTLELQTAADSLNQAFTEDAYLLKDSETRFDKLEEQIRSFNSDIESEFDELHTITDKLLTRVDDAAEDTSEGARRIAQELDALTSEVTALDNVMLTQTGNIEGAMQELKRLHDEMESVAKQRLPIVEETLTDLEAKSDQGKKATTEFNSEAKSLYNKLEQESEKQKFRMEDEVKQWREKTVFEIADLYVSNEIISALEGADARVVELLAGVDTFFQEEVVEPTSEKADALRGKVDQLKQTIDSATSEAKDARGWVDPVLQRIEEFANPLDDLINKARELARVFSPGGY